MAVKNLKIRMQCSIKDGEYIWFVPTEMSILCRYNCELSLIDFLQEIPNENFAGRSYIKILGYEDKLIFVPDMGKEIAIFMKGKCEFIKVGLPSIEGEIYTEKFSGAFVKGEYAYMIPFKYPCILKVNMRTLELDRSVNWHKLYKRCMKSVGARGVMATSAYDGNNIISFGINECENEKKGCQGIVELDSLNVYLKEPEEQCSWYRSMYWNAGKLYIYLADGTIMVENENLNVIKKISDRVLKDYGECKNLNIVYVYSDAGKVTYIRALGLPILKLDLMDNTISQDKIIDENVLYADQISNKLILQGEKQGYFYLVEGQKIQKIMFKIESKEVQVLFTNLMQRNKEYVVENSFWGLDNLMRIQRESADEGMDRKCKTIIGNAIYNDTKSI